MKNYSDLQATKLRLDIELELVGSPDFLLTVESDGSSVYGMTALKQSYEIDLLKPFSVIIELQNKNYNNVNIISI